jgi:hypothetical protein
VPLGPVGRRSGRDSPGDQLRNHHRVGRSIGRCGPRSIPELGEAVHLRTNGEEGALDPWSPRLECFRRRLEHSDAFVALILDLDVADHFEVADALLQLGDALGEVAAPVVGDDGGGVLGGGEVLQGLESAVNSSIALGTSSLRFGEATIQPVTQTVELVADGIKPLEQIIEHLADHRVHGAAGTLETGIVGVEDGGGLQHARRPEIVGSDTTVDNHGGCRSESEKNYRNGGNCRRRPVLLLESKISF